MPAGVITNSTPAASTINGTTETVWLTNTLPRPALINGTNLLAVEIHQQSTNSTDVSFNFDLSSSVIVPIRPPISISGNSSSVTLLLPADAGIFSV